MLTGNGGTKKGGLGIMGENAAQTIGNKESAGSGGNTKSQAVESRAEQGLQSLKTRKQEKTGGQLRAQTAIEYVLMISATVVFISMVAFFVKTRVIAP